ncbi:UNVERIFIED_CONTAM: hypothetical protein FKN15_067739 [Acipenser sinensis]
MRGAESESEAAAVRDQVAEVQAKIEREACRLEEMLAQTRATPSYLLVARRARMEKGEAKDSQPTPTWLLELIALLRATFTQDHQSASPRVCLYWGCGWPGHLQRQCPATPTPPVSKQPLPARGAQQYSLGSGALLPQEQLTAPHHPAQRHYYSHCKPEETNSTAGGVGCM